MTNDLKVNAEFAALQIVMRFIAPLALRSAGLTADTVEVFAQRLADNIATMPLDGPETMVAVSREASATALRSMFDDIIDNMNSMDQESGDPSTPAVESGR